MHQNVHNTSTYIYTYINFFSLIFRIRYLIYFVKSWHLFRNIIIHNRCFNNISNYIKIFVCMYHSFFSIIYFSHIKKRRTLKNSNVTCVTLDYRNGLASVNKHASAVYLSSFKLEIRFRCLLSVFAVIGWQGAAQGGESPISSTIVTTKVDHSEGRESSVTHNCSARSSIAAIADTPNWKNK